MDSKPAEREKLPSTLSHAGFRIVRRREGQFVPLYVTASTGKSGWGYIPSLLEVTAHYSTTALILTHFIDHAGSSVAIRMLYCKRHPTLAQIY